MVIGTQKDFFRANLQQSDIKEAVPFYSKFNGAITKPIPTNNYALVLGQREGWIKILYGEDVGWVFESNAKAVKEHTETEEVEFVV